MKNNLEFNFDDVSADEGEATTKAPAVYSVSELNGVIRSMLEGEFVSLWLKGEISNFKPHTSGHFYFSLKDENSQISAVMFKGLNSKLKFRPENGMEVLVRGKITVYEPRGSYQIFCETMEPVGAGALQKAFEQLKLKLQQEGLFDTARKRPIPTFPKHIGLVTARTGAALRDILNVLSRRYKSAKITLSPALVQGDPAPLSIVKAIELINQVQDVDVLIVGRGGGSMEDLWAFNDERVARAIAGSRIPIISAVGHEVDFTIADFVADLRAPTPSAAAELVVKNAADIIEQLKQLRQRLWQSWQFKVQSAAEKVLGLSKRLIDPKRRLQDLNIRCDELSLRLESSIFRYLENRRTHVRLARQRLGSPQELIIKLSRRLHLAEQKIVSWGQKILDFNKSRIAQLMSQLDALSPLRVLDRGFSIVTAFTEKSDEKNVQTGDAGTKNIRQIISSVDSAKVGDLWQVQLSKGSAKVEVLELEK